MMNFSLKGARSGYRLPAVAAGATLAAALLLCPNHSEADQVETSSSLNPVGSGARAAGMGGAFIGVADDATAASWNPAGLVQLEKPEFSVVYGYFNREQSFDSATHPETRGDNSMDANGINYASFVYPFTLADKNMVVSLNYQRLFDMNKDLKFKFNWDLGEGDVLNDNINFTQKGYISTLTPAFAIQVIPELYLGVAVNIWDDFLGTSSWESNYNSAGTATVGGIPIATSESFRTKYEFSGVNVTSGFLVNVDNFSVGGVFKSPFSGKVEQTSTDFVTGVVEAQSSHLEMPMSAGLGLAYRFSDAFLVSLDGYWTQWSEFVLKNGAGQEFNPITTNPISQGRLKDTTQVRLGTEYLFMNGKSVVPVRAGVFYDPEPGEEGVDDFFGFSVGSGYSWENYSFDLSYQFRQGNDVSSGLPNNDITSDVTQHTVLTSLIYRF